MFNAELDQPPPESPNFDHLDGEFITTRRKKRGGRSKRDEEAEDFFADAGSPIFDKETPRKGFRENLLDQSTNEEKKIRLSEARQKLIAEAQLEAQLKKDLRERLLDIGIIKHTDAEINTIMKQKVAGTTLSRVVRGHNARKESQIRREEEATTTLSRVVRGHKARKEAQIRREEEERIQLHKKGIAALEEKLRKSIEKNAKTIKELVALRQDRLQMESVVTALQAIGSPAARGPPVARGRASPRKKK